MENASLANSHPMNPAAVQIPPEPPVYRLNPRADAVLLGGQSCIGRELTVTGTITGEATLESLFVDGSVEGEIDLPASRVTVGPNGRVKAPIVAGDIVVMGEVLGDLTATHRIDIRAKASVTGNASAPRVNMEADAYFQGRLLVGAAAQEPATSLAKQVMPVLDQTISPPPEPARILRVSPEGRRVRVQATPQSA
jgi:cytoskeletal protein CcmA (bactofilin family)